MDEFGCEIGGEENEKAEGAKLTEAAREAEGMQKLLEFSGMAYT